jgi:energy-coupling factor transporter transmembrane protein EcfT
VSNSEIYLKTKKRVRAIKWFYAHFGIFVAVMIFLFLINWVTNDHPHDDWWVIFPFISWGLAIAIHALAVFIFSNNGVLGEKWEEKKIKEALEKQGLSIEQKKNISEEELNINQHLELKELEKRGNYNEEDLV